MKSTKNVLIAGVALAIALCSSVQMTAMVPEPEVNPHLKSDSKLLLKQLISNLEGMYYGNEAYSTQDIARVTIDQLNRKVNPNANAEDQNRLAALIYTMQWHLDQNNRSKLKSTDIVLRSNLKSTDIPIFKENLKKLEDMYYGDKAYSRKDIDKIVW
jgi:hypothetical protein